jgi:hypothetical protein
MNEIFEMKKTCDSNRHNMMAEKVVYVGRSYWRRVRDEDNGNHFYLAFHLLAVVDHDSSY